MDNEFGIQEDELDDIIEKPISRVKVKQKSRISVLNIIALFVFPCSNKIRAPKSFAVTQ